jgi:hypothetical protein
MGNPKLTVSFLAPFQTAVFFWEEGPGIKSTVTIDWRKIFRPVHFPIGAPSGQVNHWANCPLLELFPPHHELTDIIGFDPIPLYKNKSFLHQKYVVEGLSLAQISSQIFSSKETVRENLIRFGIPLLGPHLPHGPSTRPPGATEIWPEEETGKGRDSPGGKAGGGGGARHETPET